MINNKTIDKLADDSTHAVQQFASFQLVKLTETELDELNDYFTEFFKRKSERDDNDT